MPQLAKTGGNLYDAASFPHPLQNRVSRSFVHAVSLLCSDKTYHSLALIARGSGQSYQKIINLFWPLALLFTAYQILGA